MTIRRLKIGEADLFKEVRLAALKDAPYAFSSTYESALERSPESWTEQANNSAQGSDRATFIVFSDDKPIGMAALYRTDNQPDTGELVQVWINPEHRGTGLANKLMDIVFDWARQNSFIRIIAGITRENTKATNYYIKYGFSTADNPTQKETNEILLAKEVNKSQL